MYAAAGPTDFHGREVAALDFAKTVNRYLDLERARSLDVDLGALDTALLHDQQAYLGLGTVPTASTAPVVASDVATVEKDYQAVAGSCAAPSSAAASPSPTVVVSDNPAFDLTGSGDACQMHYFQDDQGRTVTMFTLTADGELITHVSGPPGIGRHDEQMTRGVSRLVYDFPLSQATDMGALLYLPNGTQQSCTIAPGS